MAYYYNNPYGMNPYANQYYMQPQNQQMQSIAQQQPTPPTQQPMQQAQQNNGIIWVQGEEAAKAYLVAPNSSVQLWDTEKQTIYMKSADQNGIPSIRILDWVERTATPTQANNAVVDTVSRKEFDELVQRVNALTAPKEAEQNG